MILQKQKPATPWLLIVLLSIVAASSILLGFLYYRSHKRSLVSNKMIELSAIADIKVDQIAHWRDERLGDARLIGGNASYIRQLHDYLYKKDITYKEISASLKSLSVYSDYKDVVLIDSLGRLKGKFPGNDTLYDENLKSPMIPDMAK